MTNPYIAHRRLRNQRLAASTFDNPGDVVAWLGAVQAQDYLGALWAIGLRTGNAMTEESVERAIADKAIVRTWPMRGTLHFVAAADIRWMLDLLNPRIVEGSARRLRQLGLDEEVFARSKELFERTLQGGRQVRRGAMYELLEAANIPTAGGRGLHILSRLAQDGTLCFGAREGRQPTFALLEEWVPGARKMARDEALAELARRYFTSHGPATLQDFAWWSGLKMADAKAALEMSRPHLAQEIIDGRVYWFSSSLPEGKPAEKNESPAAYLLPPFDEYTVAYKDRGAVLDPLYAKEVNTGNGIFAPAIVIDGRLVGTWKRAIKKDAVVITPTPFTAFGKADARAFAAAANRYGEFLNATVVLP